MVTGWSSIETAKVLEPIEDEDLYYQDENNRFYSWVNDNGQYVPRFADNKMTISKDSGSTSRRYKVTYRDGTKRYFGEDSKLAEEVDTNGNSLTFTHTTDYFLVSDGRGRDTYYHRTTQNPQPYEVSDSSTPGDINARRYQFSYYGSSDPAPDRLKSIIDPEGQETVYTYSEDGRLVETKLVRPSHGNVVTTFEYYDETHPDYGKLKSTSYNGLQRETREYLVQIDGFYATKFTLEDLNSENGNEPREMYQVLDNLGRTVRTYQLYTNDPEPSYNLTIIEYNDPDAPPPDPLPSDPNEIQESDDPYLPTKVIAPNGAITQYFYTARGNLKKVIDAQGNGTVYKYAEQDSSSNIYSTFPDYVLEIQRPDVTVDGVTTTYLPTKFTYETNTGNLLSVEDSDQKTTSFSYNSNGQVTEVTNRRGFKTTYDYDTLTANLTKVGVQKSLDPQDDDPQTDFRYVEFDYDDYDNVTGVLDANGNSVGAQYDGVDRPTTVTDGKLVDTVFEYLDGLLQQVQLPDSAENETSSHTGRLALMEYDSAGRPLAAKRQDNANSAQLRVGYGYDGFSQLRSLKRIKNGLEKSHTATYDRQGRTVSSTDFNGNPSTAAYEPFCVGHATTSARGVRRKASFDTLCRLTQIEVGTKDINNPLEVAMASETRSFEYDDLGRLTKTTQSTSQPSVYGVATYGVDTYGSGGSRSEERFYLYDALDRLKKVTFEDGKTMEYEYDDESNLTQVTENASSATPKVTQFSYYGDNRLYQITHVRSGGNQVFTYAYDPGGRPLTLTYPSSTGIVAHFDDGATPAAPGWDENGQLKHLRYVKGGTTIRRFEYDYDDSGNRISQLDVTPSKATKWAYGYDWLDRLESVKKATGTTPGTLGALQLVSMYTYDAADNRIEFQVPNLNPSLTETFTYSYKDGDEIESISKTVGAGSPVVIENFTSDDDGNLLTRTSTATSVTTTYTWDHFNRLAAVSASDASKNQTHTFGVNGFRRKKKDKNNVETTEYAAGLATAVSKAQSGDTVTYLMGGGGIMGFERSSDGAMFYFLTDALSTVRDIVDSGGTVKASYEFSEYGAKISDPNTNGVESQKTFVGGMSVQDEVDDTGLMMMGHRFYDQTLGRFLSRDPIGFKGGLNLYSYADNAPNGKVDPAGLYSLFDLLNPQGAIDWYNDKADTYITDSYWSVLHPGALFFRTMAVGVEGSPPATAQDFAIAWGDQNTSGWQRAWKTLAFALSVTPFGVGARASTTTLSEGNALLRVQRCGGFAEIRKVIQTGGNKIKSATAKALNEWFDVNLGKREWGRGLERLKKYIKAGNDAHWKIYNDADVEDPLGDIVGNIAEHMSEL